MSRRLVHSGKLEIEVNPDIIHRRLCILAGRRHSLLDVLLLFVLFDHGILLKGTAHLLLYLGDHLVLV